jgi:hypothetical protein
VAEALSQEEPMGFEGQKRVESYFVVVVVVVVVMVMVAVVVVQLGTGTHGGGEGSLECDVAAANEWTPNQDRD